ncbi:unnamed protein product, partial [Effrenium voratum]
MAFLFLALLCVSQATKFHEGTHILKPIQFHQKLRLCNAYPGKEVFHVERDGAMLTAKDSLKYKECGDANLTEPLAPGDHLNFHADGLPMGTFTIDSLPQYNAMLYVVVQRRDATDAVSFQSHIFASARNAQIAVMDSYVGRDKAALLLANSTGAWEGTVLPFGTAFGLANGSYQVVLSDGSAGSLRRPLQVVDGERRMIWSVFVADFSNRRLPGSPHRRRGRARRRSRSVDLPHHRALVGGAQRRLRSARVFGAGAGGRSLAGAVREAYYPPTGNSHADPAVQKGRNERWLRAVE